jgi:hypothetical protein
MGLADLPDFEARSIKFLVSYSVTLQHFSRLIG